MQHAGPHAVTVQAGKGEGSHVVICMGPRAPDTQLSITLGVSVALV